MKTTISLIAMLVTTFSAVTIAVAGTDSDESAFSVMAASATVQDEAAPPTPAVQDAVQEAVAPVPVDPAVIQAPAELGLNEPVPVDPAMMGSVVMNQPITVMNVPVASACNTCCQPTCCCPPKPRMTTFCLVDPCGCSHQANVCVPGCCVGQEPCITWKNGVFGRQIATMCWKCCDHQVKVIVTRRGKVKVRG